MSGYATVVADPPWPQKKAGPLRGGVGEHFVGATQSQPMPYSTMTVEEIAALPVDEVAAADAHLYLWTTSRFLREAFDVMAAWGFAYSTTLVWSKAPIGAGLGGAYGISSEYILFGRRGKLPTTSRIGRTVFDWKRPYDERGKPLHSAKPPAFFGMVEQVSPGPRLEMFSRVPMLGWSSWGDQATTWESPPSLDERRDRSNVVVPPDVEDDIFEEVGVA